VLFRPIVYERSHLNVDKMQVKKKTP